MGGESHWSSGLERTVQSPPSDPGPPSAGVPAAAAAPAGDRQCVFEFLRPTPTPCTHFRTLTLITGQTFSRRLEGIPLFHIPALCQAFCRRWGHRFALARTGTHPLFTVNLMLTDLYDALV